MPGIEPGAFHMQSERATTALHPLPQQTWKTDALNKTFMKADVRFIRKIRYHSAATKVINVNMR